MKKYIGLIIGLLPLIACLSGRQASAQLVLSNNYYVVLSGGSLATPTKLILGDSLPSGITNLGSGWIISENEFNIVQWNIGASTGNYVVPFGYSVPTQYLPLTLNIDTAGKGPGYVKFSTYHTPALNSAAQPSDVTNVNAFITPGSPSNADDSYNIADRFYIIDADSGYTTKPTIGNIIFSYISGTPVSEVAIPNILTESRLMGQRFNSVTSTWSDWFGEGCTDRIVGNVGYVQTGPVSAANLFRSWTLWDQTMTLPMKLAATSILCGGSSTGKATATVYGGALPYTYSWMPSGGTSATASGLSAGIYTVSVTDSHGCNSTLSVAITQPVKLTPLINVTSDVGCNGGSNGSASSTVSGGIVPYTYSWTGGSTNTSISGLTAGTYILSVSDSNACTATTSASITQPLVLKASATVASNVSCNGVNNGSASSAVSGGTLPYTYSWTGGSTNVIASGLSAGTYMLNVSDNNGCTATASALITQPLVLTASATVTSNVACNGGSIGSASSAVSGGTSPYTYSWTGGSANATVSGLTAGTYLLNVSDNNGCTATASAVITQPSALMVSAAVTSNIACNGGNNGSASSTVSGGVSPYTYIWTGGNTGTSVSGLSAGTYNLMVSDANGCSGLSSVTITEPVSLIATAIVNANATACNANGAATAMPFGGTIPYTYLWTGGNTDATATGLAAGPYTVTVTDNNGCTASASATITAPIVVTAGTTVDANAAACAAIGKATVIPGGGASPYHYLWTGGSTNITASGLSAGTYTVTVKDVNGCTATASAVITAPAAVSASIAVNANASACSDDGNATVNPVGGTAPYAYLWTGGNTDVTISGLSAGTYTVAVKDANGCSATASAAITAPAAVSANTVVNANTSECNSTGSATVNPAGGNSPFLYIWSDGNSNATASGLSAGTYTVTARDANGCSATAKAIITAPAALSLKQGSIPTAQGKCSGSAWVTVSGGAAPYTYSWNISGNNTNDSITGQCAGDEYCVQVTDNNGCVDNACVKIVTGIPDISNSSSVKVYPNPNNGNFTVQGVIRGQVIELYNYLGQQLTSVIADNETMYFDISAKANGIYLVRIQNKDGSVVTQKKIVKTQ